MGKIKRSQHVTFIDTTPTATNPTWVLLGTGITDLAIAFNPQITTEKWIIHDNATSSLDSNQKQADVSQKIYSEDPAFEYVYGLMDKTGGQVESHILDIDTYKPGSTEGTYLAKQSNAIIAVTNYMGEDAVIEYSLYYNGDPVEGTATISNGVPTFTPNA